MDINIEKAMKGYILHRELYPDEIRHYRDISYTNKPFGFGNQIHEYGFDERFLKHVIYYFAASKGQLFTIVTNKDHESIYRNFTISNRDYLIQKDYEYVYRFNPNPIFHR